MSSTTKSVSYESYYPSTGFNLGGQKNPSMMDELTQRGKNRGTVPKEGCTPINVAFDEETSKLALRRNAMNASVLGTVTPELMAPRQGKLILAKKNGMDSENIIGSTCVNGISLNDKNNASSEVYEETHYIVGVNDSDEKILGDGTAVSSSLKAWYGGVDNIQVDANVVDGQDLYWSMPKWNSTDDSSLNALKGREISALVKPFDSDLTVSTAFQLITGGTGKSATLDQVKKIVKETHRKRSKIFGQALSSGVKGSIIKFRWKDSK